MSFRRLPRLRSGVSPTFGRSVWAASPQLRHRAFLAARLRPASSGMRAQPIPRILRAAARWTVQSHRTALHVDARLVRQLLYRTEVRTIRQDHVSAASSARPAGLAPTRIRERIMLASPGRVLALVRTLHLHRHAPPAARRFAAPSLPHAVAVSAPRTERSATYPRVAATVARPVAPPAPVVPPPEAVSHDAPRRAERGFLPGSALHPMPVTALAAPELARVTEHVIDQLERRALSYRERTGTL